MDEILRLVLMGAAVISLVALVAYALVFAVVVATTVRDARRPDPLAAELDRLLAELTGGERGGRAVPVRRHHR